MSVFDTARRLIYRDPNMTTEALYRVGNSGAGVGVRVNFQTGSSENSPYDMGVVSETVTIRAQVEDCPALAEGDSFEIDGTRYFVNAAPTRRAGGSVWLAQTPEA